MEWYDENGDWQWVQFQSDTSIFQDRPSNTLTQSKSDNTIANLPADTFSTSIEELAIAVEAAGNAYFCLATRDTPTTDVDVAWAVLPGDHVDWARGCIGADWNAMGIFYSEPNFDPGFVGFSRSGVSKGLNDAATHQDL